MLLGGQYAPFLFYSFLWTLPSVYAKSMVLRVDGLLQPAFTKVITSCCLIEQFFHTDNNLLSAFVRQSVATENELSILFQTYVQKT